MNSGLAHLPCGFVFVVSSSTLLGQGTEVELYKPFCCSVNVLNDEEWFHLTTFKGKKH
jgi:hypothetical protein